MKNKIFSIASLFLVMFAISASAATTQWSQAEAQQWQTKQPWLVGANYIPANAVNTLEMWQADTFSPALIEQELALAQSTGMNTMRVFLHDLLWEADPAGFAERIDIFLAIAEKHKIKVLLVLFDSCWNANPHLGPQPPPIPGVHNSG
ncbi:MAG: 1,4-beta-xylanase, partial [Proteobacteria bacterium]